MVTEVVIFGHGPSSISLEATTTSQFMSIASVSITFFFLLCTFDNMGITSLSLDPMSKKFCLRSNVVIP